MGADKDDIGDMSMDSPILQAAKFLLENPDYKPMETSVRSGRGRPKNGMRVGPVVLSMAEYEELEANRHVLVPVPVMSAEEYRAAAQAKAPELLWRAVELALKSNDVREVLMVSKEVADRAHGKATQSVAITDDRDLRSTWKQVKERSMPMIEVGVGNEDADNADD